MGTSISSHHQINLDKNPTRTQFRAPYANGGKFRFRAARGRYSDVEDQNWGRCLSVKGEKVQANQGH
jgi:hypothetical protein